MMTHINSTAPAAVGFVFDKIHLGPASTLLDEAERDNIMIGRFVLVKYCDTNFLPQIKELIENGSPSDYEEGSDARQYLMNYRIDQANIGKYGYFGSKDRMIYQKLYNSETGKVAYKETGYFGRVSTVEEIEIPTPNLNSLLYINNNPLQVSLGGVLKENHQNGFDSTMKELLDELLYPYVAPSITSIILYENSTKLGTTQEKGVLTPKQITRITASLAKGSADLKSVTFYNGTNVIGSTTLNANATQLDYTLATPITLTDSTTIKIELTDWMNKKVSATSTINVYYPIYYGKILETLSVDTNTLNNANKIIRNVGNMSINYPQTATNESIFIAYPAVSNKAIKSIIDPAGFTQTWNPATLEQTLADGSHINYYVYTGPAAQRDAGLKYTFNF